MFGVPAIKSGYVSPIKNSLRFRAANSARMNRTPGTPTNNLIWTFSTWVKRGTLGAVQTIIDGDDGASTNFMCVRFLANDTIDVAQIATVYNLQAATTAVFRDPGAWYHIVVIYDSPNATAADRFQLWVNGVRQTLTYTTGPVAQNTASQINLSGRPMYLGYLQYAGIQYFDGLMARVEFIDGQALTPSSFGQTSTTTGQWVPKAYTGTYGTNGFRLDFADTTSTTTLGYDAAGSNDWTLTNFSVTSGVTDDRSVDVPTNSYATLNPVYPSSSGLSNANLAHLSTTNDRGNVATIEIPSTGVWWAEFTPTAIPGGYNLYVGLNTAAVSLTASRGGRDTGYVYENDGDKILAGSSSAYGASYAVTDVIGILVNKDAATLEYFKQTGGTGNFVSQGVISSLPNNQSYYWVGTGGGASSVGGHWNFGQRTFNYVAQHGSLPSSAKALCTANLPTPAIRKSSDGFALATDTEANIEATLAAARAGWGADAYVDILKNRAASETWAWRFSHDASNEHAVSTTDTYQTRASRTMSGSNAWIGHSIRIGSTYGTAAGSAAHTNGAATTITHNLNRARTSIFLFPRAGGDIYVYHPDVAAGSLLILNSTAAAAASTRITSVGVNSFQIGSTAATGTYDYLVVSEIEGFMDLGTYGGNSSSDGTFSFNTVRPRWYFTRATASGVSWMVWNDLSDGYNVANDEMNFDTSDAEAVSADVDLLSNGVKFRRSSTNFNNTGSTYVTWAWGNPFKTANAR